MSQKNRITFIAELRDHISGSANKAAKATENLEKTSTRAGKHIAQAHDKAADHAEKGSDKTRRSLTKMERAFKALDGSASRMGRALGESWDEAERGPGRALSALTGTGRRMVSEADDIGRRMGRNISTGVQQGIDNIDVSGLTTALGGLTVGGGVMGSLDQDRTARRIGAASGTDHEAIRGLVGGVYGAGLGADYESVAGSAWALVATIDVEAGSPEAERLLMGQMGIADAYQLPADRLALATKILMDSDSLTASASQDVIAAALKQSNPGAQDEVLDALLEYGPLLRGTGIDNSVLASALAAASANGPMAVDKTGDAFKEWAVRTSTADKTTMDAYAELGMDGGGISSRLQEGDAGALRDTASALLGVQDEATRARLAMEIMGAPLEDLGPAQITEHLRAWEDMGAGVLDTAGATSELTAALTSGAGADTTTMVRALSGAFVAVGDALAPVVTPLANIVTLLAKPIAVGATVLTAYGAVSRLPGGAALAKNSLKALWRVFTITPIGRAVTLVWGLGEAFGWLYDNVEPVRDVVDMINGLFETMDERIKNVGRSIEELVRDKFPQLNEGMDSMQSKVAGFDDGSLQASIDNTSFGGNPVLAWAWGKLTGGDDEEDLPHHADGGWTASGAHKAVLGEEGREFVVNHWASEKLASVPGALGSISKGKLPAVGVPVAAGAGGGGVSIGELHVHTAATDGADFARQFAAEFPKHYVAAKDQDERRQSLTYMTYNRRGAH